MVALGEEDLPEGALAQLPLEHDVLALDVTDTWGAGHGSDRSGAARAVGRLCPALGYQPGAKPEWSLHFVSKPPPHGVDKAGLGGGVCPGLGRTQA